MSIKVVLPRDNRPLSEWTGAQLAHLTRLLVAQAKQGPWADWAEDVGQEAMLWLLANPSYAGNRKLAIKRGVRILFGDSGKAGGCGRDILGTSDVAEQAVTESEQEGRAEVSLALDAMPLKTRQLISLRFVMGCAREAAAMAVGLPLRTATNHALKGRQELLRRFPEAV